MPGIDLATESSTDLIFMPKGGRAIMATNMPSSCKSMVKSGFPVIIFLVSTFFLETPTILKSLTSFKGTSCSSGRVMSLAKDANSP